MAVLFMSLDQDLPVIRTRFTPRVRVCIAFEGESLTEQYHKDDCDIHSILNRFVTTGVLPFSETKPIYGDFSNVKTYQEAQTLIARVNGYFESLPAQVRQRFGNDPSKFLDFVNDPKNREEGEKLGIFEPVPVEQREFVKYAGDPKNLSGDIGSPITDKKDPVKVDSTVSSDK